jgi:hypothetical protein
MLRTKPPNDKLEIKVLDFGTWRKQNPRTRTTRNRSLTGIWNSFVFSLKGEKPGQEEKLTMEVSGGEPYMRSSRWQPKDLIVTNEDKLPQN